MPTAKANNGHNPPWRSVFQTVMSLHQCTLPRWILHPYQRQPGKLMYYLVCLNTHFYQWGKCVIVDVLLPSLQTKSQSNMMWPQSWMGRGTRMPAFGDFPFKSRPPATKFLPTLLTMYMNNNQSKTQMCICMHDFLVLYKTH
jgi:hypothetical protein